MLSRVDFDRMLRLVRADAPREQIQAAAREIQRRLNPHPAGQMELNVPTLDGRPLQGMQHKYRETVLFFPAAGQTCHAYCTYCFRWAQFVGLEELKFASRQADSLVHYLRAHPEVASVLITGGDPMVMKATVLERYIEPLLHPSLAHVRSLRIGSKASAYWPYRFVTDADADDLLRLFERVREAGKTLAFMAHYSHPRELEIPIAREALRRIQGTGAVVRTQAPLIRHVNASRSRFGSARCRTTCSSSATRDPAATSRFRWRALSRFSTRRTGGSPVWGAPCAARRCPRRPARCSSTA
jgi:L-lysine 2,3-aminomutase